MLKLSTSNVNKIFLDCLFKDNEIGTDGKPIYPSKMVDGIKAKFGFHNGRLMSHKKEIHELLEQLPDNFKTCDKEVGISFLEMCYDVDGIQWGEHPNMEQLMALGIGVGLITSILPRELWQHLPGEMPVLAVNVKPRGSN